MNAKEAMEALKLEGGIEITGNLVRIGAFFEALVEAEKALEEVQKYRQIGTVEECWRAVEKQEPKRPIDADEDYGFFICPVCKKTIYASDDFETHKFCLNCGQAIQWDAENLEAAEER